LGSCSPRWRTSACDTTIPTLATSPIASRMGGSASWTSNWQPSSRVLRLHFVDESSRRAGAIPASLEWFCWTDCGKVRPRNEDSFVGLRFDSREMHHLGRQGRVSVANMDVAFAVSDGMGGALAGEFASRITVHDGRDNTTAIVIRVG